MFRLVRSALSVLVLPALLAACASQPSVETAPKEAAKPRHYTTALIGKVATTLIDDDNPDNNRIEDKKALDAKIPAVLKEALEDNDLAMAAALPENKSSTVVINLDIRYNPGNRALRWTAGVFGAGKGVLHAKMEAIDAATGSVVASRSDSHTTRMGAFGGDFYGSVEDMVEDLTSDLVEDLNAKTP